MRNNEIIDEIVKLKKELLNPQYHTFVGHVKRGTPAFELKQIMRIKKDLINQLKKAQKKIHKITSNTIKNGERISNKRFIKLNEKLDNLIRIKTYYINLIEMGNKREKDLRGMIK